MSDGRSELRIRDISNPQGFSVVPILEEHTLFDIRHGKGNAKRTSVSLVRFDTPTGELSRLFVCSDWNLSGKPARTWMWPYDALPVHRVLLLMQENPKAVGNALSRRRASDVVNLLCRADGHPGRDEEIRQEFTALLDDLGVDFETVDTEIGKRTADDGSWAILMRLTHGDADAKEDS